MRFKGLVASKRTHVVRLKKPLTIILAYWTVEGDADGSVLFRDNVYARDATTFRALNGRSRVRILHRKRVQPRVAAFVLQGERSSRRGRRLPSRVPGSSLNPAYGLAPPTLKRVSQK